MALTAIIDLNISSITIQLVCRCEDLKMKYLNLEQLNVHYVKWHNQRHKVKKININLIFFCIFISNFSKQIYPQSKSRRNYLVF